MKTKHHLQEFINAMLNEELTGHAANRANFIKEKLLPHWKGLPGYPDIDTWLEKIAEADPTVKKIYLPWLARLAVSKPQENKMEDIDRVGEDLRQFEANKARITNKDINQYKSFQDLFDVIAPFLVPKEKTKDDIAKEKEAAKLAAIKGQIETVYDGPQGWIRIPKTIEAAKFLGQNTRWCTASAGNNMFNHYNKSDVMFVVYQKGVKARAATPTSPAVAEQPAQRYQMHIDSGQFADEADRNKQFGAVPHWAWDPIIKWYQKNNPDLGIKHLMTLGAHSEENLAKGTVHENLLDLMREYGLN